MDNPHPLTLDTYLAAIITAHKTAYCTSTQSDYKNARGRRHCGYVLYVSDEVRRAYDPAHKDHSGQCADTDSHGWSLIIGKSDVAV